MKKIIIDNNLICALLAPAPPADISDLASAVLFGRKYNVELVLGGRLEDEYFEHVRYKKIYIQLIRAGRMKKYPRNIIDTEEKNISENLNPVSDDPHVLALARASGTRLLCSRDQPLHQDFGNKNIIDNPRGKVWQNCRHNHLLA